MPKPGMRAVLTRTGDYYIPLRSRYERAREHRADLFISIHADAFENRSVAAVRYSCCRNAERAVRWHACWRRAKTPQTWWAGCRSTTRMTC